MKVLNTFKSTYSNLVFYELDCVVFKDGDYVVFKEFDKSFIYTFKNVAFANRGMIKKKLIIDVKNKKSDFWTNRCNQFIKNGLKLLK